MLFGDDPCRGESPPGREGDNVSRASPEIVSAFVQEAWQIEGLGFAKPLVLRLSQSGHLEAL